MSNTHTPGPWAYRETATHILDRSIIGKSFTVSPVSNKKMNISHIHSKNESEPFLSQFRYEIDKAEANARLIAAAPELLEALEEGIEITKGLANSHHFQMVWQENQNHAENFSECKASTCRKAFENIKKSEAAIAKAKGE